MDFLDRLKDYIEGLPFTPSTVHIGLYNENGNSMAIRPVPSSIDERYMEGGKIYPFSFQILMHHQSSNFAYESLNQLTSELDNLGPNEITTRRRGYFDYAQAVQAQMPKRAITSSDGSFVLVTIQCTTTPNYVEKTGYGTLWTAIYQADLYIKGGN